MSFLSDYALYTKGDEVAPIYHMWSGLSALSHFAGRRLWVSQERFLVYPHLYCILVGDPGNKKSSAMRASKSLVLLTDPTLQVAASADTKESIMKKMGSEDSECLRKFIYKGQQEQYTQLAIFADEFINLINAGGNPGGMIDFLTQLFTEQDSFRNDTKGKGRDTILHPYVSILGCMTTDVAHHLASTKIISSGMTRRCLFIYGPECEIPIARPKLTDEQREARIRLVAHGRTVLTNAGEFTLTSDADALYTTLYDRDFFRKKNSASSVFKSFLETKGEYVLKAAMLAALSDDAKSIVLDAKHIQIGHDLVSQIEQGCMQLFEGVGRNVLSPIAANIERIINLEPKPVLVKRIYVMEGRNASVAEIDQVMSDLMRMDKAYRFTVTVKGVTYEFISTKEKYEVFERERKANAVPPGTSA